MKRLATKQFFKREHQKMIVVDDYVYIGSSNIGDEYAGFDYKRAIFLDFNIRLKNILSWQAQQVIEHVFLKHKEKKHLFSKTSIKKSKMLEKLKTMPHRFNSLLVKDYDYDLRVSKCGKRMENQHDLSQHVKLIRYLKPKTQLF